MSRERRGASMPPMGYGESRSPSILDGMESCSPPATSPAASERLFYRKLIRTADARLDAHIERLKRASRAAAPYRKK